MRPNSVWSIEPQQGEIPPEESFEVMLTATVDDVVRFQDKLQVNFLESQSRTIPVEAYGDGTTIICDPPVSSQAGNLEDTRDVHFHGTGYYKL